MKELLSRYGYLHVWQNKASINKNNFLKHFKQRLIDEFLQGWNRNVLDSAVLSLYRNVKTRFGFESYLNDIVPRNLRIALTKLRISGHSLRIHTGRYDRTERNLRICQICNCQEIEDEYHFIFQCRPYQALRSRYIKNYFIRRPSMYKLIELLSSQNKNELYLLSKYLFEASKIRTNMLSEL